MCSQCDAWQCPCPRDKCKCSDWQGHAYCDLCHHYPGPKVRTAAKKVGKRALKRTTTRTAKKTAPRAKKRKK